MQSLKLRTTGAWGREKRTESRERDEPEMRGKLRNVLALLLAVLLLAGCGAESRDQGGALGEDQVFDEIEYQRPELSEMEQAVAELQACLGRLCLPGTLEDRIEDCYDCYYHFETMLSLADIRNCQDLTDPFYSAEYAWCLENLPRIQQLVEEMYSSCATSIYAPILERLFFWEGFTELYGSGERARQPEEIYELYRQENQLINQYRSIIADPYIQLDGELVSLEEYMAATADVEEFYRAMDAYYQQYNPQLGDIYVQLVQLRREQARLLGYDSYEQMQYQLSYERDYSPEQAAVYLENIKEYLGPAYLELMSSRPYEQISWEYMSPEELLDIMSAAAGNMGADIMESFEFMDRHRLCDIQQRPYKAAISFQTYLSDYEAPFLFLSPYGDQGDLLSFAHEFGHFTDAYINCNAYETTDLAECFSQSMEFLLLFYLEGSMEEEAIEELRYYKAVDTMEMYIGQAAVSEFESRAFRLPGEELSTEKLNSLYLEICADYGMCDGSVEELGLGWIDVTHLFESPFYVISYPVTNDVAMQLYALEQDSPGSGLEKFSAMLPRVYEGLLPSLEEAGLDSPFEPGRLEEVLSCLEPALSLGKKS